MFPIPSLCFGLTIIAAIFMRRLRLPILVGFLLMGIILQSHSSCFESYPILAEYGAAFLLFTIGLEINLDFFKKLGRSIITMSVLNILLCTLIYYFVLQSFGYNIITSIIFAILLSLSSTILVATILRDKREMQSHHARVLIGSLLFQDLIAIVFLFVLPYFGENNSDITGLIQRVIISLLTTIIIVLIGRWFFGYLIKYFQHQDDLIFLISITWLLVIMDIFHLKSIGLPTEIAGLVAGFSISNAIDKERVISWFDPIKDFLIVFLFFYVGTQINATRVEENIGPIVWLSLIILGTKLLIGFINAGQVGYPKKIIAYTGIGLANLSEMTFVIMPLSARLGLINEENMSIFSIIIIISLIFSSILIYNTQDIYQKMYNFFGFFEKKSIYSFGRWKNLLQNKIVLIGCHRSGNSIIKRLNRQEKNDLVIIDYNYATTQNLQAKGYNAICGDGADRRFLLSIGINKARMIISTLPKIEDNLILSSLIKKLPGKRHPIFISLAKNRHESKKLMENNANLAINPYISAAGWISSIITSQKKQNAIKRIKNIQKNLSD